MNDLEHHTIEHIVLTLIADNLNEPWQVFASREPDSPDRCITVYNTSGIDDGRLMLTGQVQEHYGILLQVRGTNSQSTGTKANKLAASLDALGPDTIVTIDNKFYNVKNMSRSGSVNNLGRDRQNSNRFIFTINYLVTVLLVEDPPTTY